MKLGVAVIGCLITALVPAAAPTIVNAKTLEWRLLAVDARLDADGRLHVREEQAIVLTGDWNGAQRIFRLAPGQKIQLKSMSRIGDGGEVIPLVHGDLDQVDHYDWVGSNTLRWRRRRPEDPPFAATEITYVLNYTLSNILVPQANDREFRLDHDFAFAKREGSIHQFTLALELDPAWRPLRGNFSGSYARGPLPPGESFVLGIPLRYLGAAPPAAVWYGASPGFRNALAIFLLLAVALASLRYLVRERALGRFTPLTPASAIDERWLDEHVFTYKPEVVGAAFDHTTSAPEVGAVIARMVAEGKIKSRVEEKRARKKAVLHLELAADRDDLEGYEKTLVDALFFSGRTTDTERIRKPLPEERIRSGREDPGADRGHRARIPRAGVALARAGHPAFDPAPHRRGRGIDRRRRSPPERSGHYPPGSLCRDTDRRLPRHHGLSPPAAVGRGPGAHLGIPDRGSGVDDRGCGRRGRQWRRRPALADRPRRVRHLCLRPLPARAHDRHVARGERRDRHPPQLRRRAQLLCPGAAGARAEAQGRLDPVPDCARARTASRSLVSRLRRRHVGSDGHEHGVDGRGHGGSSGGGHGGGWTGGGGAFGGAGASSSWAAMGTMAAGVPSPSDSSSGGGGGGWSSGGGGGGGW